MTAEVGGIVSYSRRRWLVPTVLVVLTLILTVGVGGNRLYHHPHVDRLPPGQHVDAVVALGGRLESATYAQRLVEAGTAPVLVLSDPYPAGLNQPVDDACASHPAGYRVICFAPHPSTTRGEARQIETLARTNGWTRVAVVLPVFHVTRTRVLMRRCYSGTLFLLPAPMGISLPEWTYQYARQSAGFVKAGLMRSC